MKWLVFLLLSPFFALTSYLLNLYLESLVSGTPLVLPTGWGFKEYFWGLSPLGAVAIAAIALVFEAYCLGFEKSSLKRICVGEESARADLFHLFLYASNLKNIFGVVFSIGIAHLFYFWLNHHFSIAWLKEISFLPALLILSLVNSFLFYWVHRLMHTRWFWPAHQVHHSATTLNLITNFRNHPLNIVAEMFFYAFSAALLGASAEVTATYLILNGFYQLFAHSNLPWRLHGTPWEFFQTWVLLAPEEHRIHHSQLPEHWHKNFGLTPLWDRVFGTWLDSRNTTRDFPIGVTMPLSHKDLASFPGIFKVTAQVLRGLW